MFGLHTYRSVGSLHGRVKLKPFPAEKEWMKEPRKLQKNSKGDEGYTRARGKRERERLFSQMHNFFAYLADSGSWLITNRLRLQFVHVDKERQTRRVTGFESSCFAAFLILNLCTQITIRPYFSAILIPLKLEQF